MKQINYTSGSRVAILIILTHVYILNNLATYQTTWALQDTIHLSSLNDSILSPDAFPYEESHRCEPLQIPFCTSKDIKYNQTMMPNEFGHTTQTEANTEINIYDPLVNVGCSPDLRLFLCTVFAPMCFLRDSDLELKLKPCRSLCESARRGCEAQLKKFNIDWPAPLRCELFPEGHEGLCVGKDSHGMDPVDREQTPNRDLGFVCPKNFEVQSYTLHLNGRRYNNCAMPCEDVYLDKNSTRTVRLIVGILAILCILSSVFTCLTFLIDTKRFEYPARPIIIIAFCQLIVGSCFLIGFLTQNKIACNDPVEPKLPNMKMIRSTAMGNKKGSCTLLFMTLYFFQLSTIMWWLMMTISWYMIAKLKWAPEAVNSVARYFHFSSWTLPALMTIYLSVLGDIEGDSLSGACYIGTSNEETIWTFIILPIIICLSLGCVLLAIGFKSIWDSRRILKNRFGNQTDEHFKLVIRIGLYSTLFTLISGIYAYSYYNELSQQTTWRMAWLSNVCKVQDYSIPCPTKNYANQRPHWLVFVIKYAAAMAIGVISALFMVSEKTYKAYRRVVGECIPLDGAK